MDFKRLCVLSKRLDDARMEIDRIDTLIDSVSKNLLVLEKEKEALRARALRIQDEMEGMIAAYCDAQESKEGGSHADAT